MEIEMNTSLINSSYPDSEEWRVAQILHAFTISLCFCFVGILTAYLYRNESFSITDVLTFNKFSVVKITLLAGALFICKIICDILLLHVPYLDFIDDCQVACERTGDGSTFFGVVTLFLTMFYLWLRLHVLHCKQTELFGTKRNVCFTVLMWTCLGYLVSGTIIYLIGWTIPDAYSCTTIGCVVREDPVLDLTMIISPVWTFSVQTFILILLIYVLIKTNPSMHKESRAHVKYVVRRLIVCAVVSVLSETVSYTVILIAGSRSRSAVAIPYNLSLFINIAALLCSSDDPGLVIRAAIHRPKTNGQALSSPKPITTIV